MLNILKSLAIGGISLKQLSVNGVLAWEEPASYKNQVPISIDTDGSVFNHCGYMNGYRLSSSGIAKANEYCTVTGYIPAVGGNVIQIGGIPWHCNGSMNYLCAYDSDFNYIGGIYGTAGGSYTTVIYSEYELSNELSTIKLAPLSNIAYIRVNCHNATVPDGANMIVTVNEEIA